MLAHQLGTGRPGTVSMAPVSTFTDRLRTLVVSPTAPLVDQNFPWSRRGRYRLPRREARAVPIPSALALYARVDQDCAATIRDAWAFKRSRYILEPGADLQPLLASAFDANEPAGLHLGPLPVLVVQAASTSPSSCSSPTPSSSRSGTTGPPNCLPTYPNDDHNGVVESSLPDVEQWVDARLAEHPVTTTTTSTTTLTMSTTTTPITTTGASVMAITATSPPPTTATGTLPAATPGSARTVLRGRDHRRPGPARLRPLLRVAHQAPENSGVAAELGDARRRLAADVGAGHREDLGAVDRAHHLAAAGRDAGAQEQTVELDALVAERVALVDADDRGHEARARRPRWRTPGHASGFRGSNASMP